MAAESVTTFKKFPHIDLSTKTVMNMFEVKRRSRNEYVMYEKNEVRINEVEFGQKNVQANEF